MMMHGEGNLKSWMKRKHWGKCKKIVMCLEIGHDVATFVKY
jgi:hypothetical protein